MPRTVFLWLLTWAIFKHFALHCILSNFSFSCICLLSHILFYSLSLSFASPLCVPPQRSGLQLKLIQAWKGSDDFSWKNCILFADCFEPCYYPVACFTVIPLNRKTKMKTCLCSTVCDWSNSSWFNKISLYRVSSPKNKMYFLYLEEPPFTYCKYCKIHSTYLLTVWISCKIGFISIMMTCVVHDESGSYHVWGVLDRAEVNTGCIPLGVPRGSRVIQNGQWAFLPVHTWSLPSHAEPLGLPLFSGPSSPLLSMQQSNGVGNIRVTVANTRLMWIKQTPGPPLPIKHASKWKTVKGQ